MILIIIILLYYYLKYFNVVVIIIKFTKTKGRLSNVWVVWCLIFSCVTE